MIVLIDNRDSYTFNLAQLIASVAGEWPLVVSADDVFSARIPARLAAGEFSHLVISPGPGTPAEHSDFSGSRASLEAAIDIPTLGVCLGHQGMGLLAGATVDRAPRARHGFLSRVTHTGAGIFRKIPQDFAVVRYHSLHLRDFESAQLRVHARSEDGVVMGIEILDRPHWGVQFHPESILTEHGATLMRNFLALRARSGRAVLPNRTSHRAAFTHTTHRRAASETRHVMPRRVQTLEVAIDCETTFANLQAGASAAFWLDSSLRVGWSGRYSVLGTNLGSRARTVRYRVGGKTEVRVGDRTEVCDLDILTYLDRELNERPGADADTESRIPYLSGFFGYLGYECKALTVAGTAATHRSTQPDAYWIEPHAHIVVDHERSLTHLVVQEGDEADALLEQLRVAIQPAGKHDDESRPMPRGRRSPRANAPESWRLSEHEYASRITDIKSALLRGDSYEVCLTDTLEAESDVDGLALFRDIRRHTPAPYAAYFRFDTFGDSLEILSASPERFLSVDQHGTVESKPIKGTARRSSDPAEDAQLARELQSDPKSRAENLMIVDLLRNDLGRVCEVGSVEVPALMQIESYATVHQLVSTIRGTLREDHSLVDLLRAAFPGGSMTGAPKARTLEIIDELEAGPRGIYAGTLGYLGHDGTAELSIVIRTIVKSGSKFEIGAGGAIVLDSDVTAEIDERNLKAAALLSAVERVAGARNGN